MSAVDQALTAGPFLLIDAENRGVGWAATATQVHDAVRAGEAATWAALPRQGVVAIDLDGPEGLSWMAADCLTGWCRTRNLWWLLRESGTPGHLHLWVLAQAHEEELAQFVDAVRGELRLTRAQLNDRSSQHIRPLSAPHRRGRRGTADGLTAEHLDDLTRRLGDVVLAPRRIARTHRPDHTSPSDRRPVLRRRTARATDAPKATGDRSHDEFMITLTAHNAGLTADEAWGQVAALDGHSAERGRQWWQRCMWDRIRPAEGSSTRLIDAARSIDAIAARLNVLPGLDARAAKSLDAVLWVLGEYVADGQTPTPVSVRDIEGATGLATDTVCAALRRAETAGLMTRHVSPRPDDAHAWTWGPTIVRGVAGTPCLTPPAAGWLHTLPRGSATALTLHLLGLLLPRDLIPLLPQALAVTTAPALVESQECPAWPRIRSERDSYHGLIRAARVAYHQRWETERAQALRRQREHALAWKRDQLARLHSHRAAQQPLPPFESADTAPAHEFATPGQCSAAAGQRVAIHPVGAPRLGLAAVRRRRE